VAEEERERLGITPQMRRCIEGCSESYTVVTETLSYSLDNGGPYLNDEHLRLLIDAGEILQATQNSLLRLSPLATMLCTVSAEACEKVAESCRELDGSDPQLIACAESCDHTANCCRELAI
jgi:hypothetical protein